MSTFFFLQAFGGFFNGYTAAKLYQFFNGSQWKLLVALSCCLYPFSLFSCYIIVDTVNEDYSTRLFSSEGISAATYFYLWLFSNLPSTCYAAYSAFITQPVQVPTKQTRLARDIPICDARMRRVRALFSSLLPFFALYLQFGQLSAASYAIAGGQSPPASGEVKLSGFTSMKSHDVSGVPEDSYKLTVLFFALVAVMYLIIVA